MGIYHHTHYEMSKYEQVPLIDKFQPSTHWIGGYLYKGDGIYTRMHKLAIL